MIKSFWTPELDNELISLLADMTLSVTALKIGELVGKPVTRSAIAGRKYRLTQEGVSIKCQTHTIGGKPRGANPRRVRRTRNSGEIREKSERKVHVPLNAPEPLNLDIFTVGHNQCRFPVSGEGYQTLFCGHVTPDGLSYCGWHCSIAYEPPRARAKRPHPEFKKFKPQYRAA